MFAAESRVYPSTLQLHTLYLLGDAVDQTVSLRGSSSPSSRRSVPAIIRALLIGLVYYAAAWLGVNETMMPGGIAILWPANAVLLAAFLLSPYRQWLAIGAAALIAECVADVPAFPLWSAIAFGVINLFETSLAAWLIHKTVGRDFDFDNLKRGGYFLLCGPLLASALAALFGAAVYDLLDRAGSDYWTTWRLWWFGDALGLLLLTPFIMTMWRWLNEGPPRPDWPRLLEIAGLWLALVLVGLNTFPQSIDADAGFHISPLILLPFSAWAAVRFGVTGAALTVVIIAIMAVGFMVRGIHPYTVFPPSVGVWMMQEYLGVVALLSFGLAILLHEIRKQKDELERRVRERTAALQHSNQALAAANTRLSELASTDYLTGIANRRHFKEIAQRELGRLAANNSKASLIIFDLDHFKQINDRFGHEAGDKVLCCVVRAVQETVRPMDLLGRFGGEEFLILLPEAERVTALEIAERIRKKVERLRCEHHGTRSRITISLGVAPWHGAESLDELIRHADKALYRAKEKGRNRVQWVPSEEPAR